MELNEKVLINELRKHLHSKYKNISIIYIEYDHSIIIQFTNLFSQDYSFRFYFGEVELVHMINQFEMGYPPNIVFGEITYKMENELNKRFKSLLFY